MLVCVDCLSKVCTCLKDQENIVYIPPDINSSHLLYEEKHLDIYDKILEKYVQRWKSISLIELRKIMNLNTLTTTAENEEIGNDTVCKLCLEDSQETRLGHYLLIFYSLSLPLTNQVLVDLFILWALSRNQPHKLSEWINTITPIDVAFHFFFNCCGVNFKPDEYDDFTSKRVQTERTSLLKYIYKTQLNGSIQNIKEVYHIRDELLYCSTNNINPSDNGLCTCNQIKVNIGEDIMKGRCYKTQRQIFLDTNDALVARKNKEAQAIQSKASAIIKQRTTLNELSCCIIGSNGVIYSNKERNAKPYYSDSKRFETLNHVVGAAENEILQNTEENVAIPYQEDEEELPFDDDDFNDDEQVAEMNTEPSTVPSVINMFDLYKTPCKLCDKLLMKKHYNKFNKISNIILSQSKEKLGQSIQTIIMLLKNEECESFLKKDICYHYSNSLCILNDFRYWQFYNVTGFSITKVQDEELIKHMLKTSVYSRSCTVCIDLYVAVVLDQINSFKSPGLVKLGKWVRETMNKHLI